MRRLIRKKSKFYHKRNSSHILRKPQSQKSACRCFCLRLTLTVSWAPEGPRVVSFWTILQGPWSVSVKAEAKISVFFSLWLYQFQVHGLNESAPKFKWFYCLHSQRFAAPGEPLTFSHWTSPCYPIHSPSWLEQIYKYHISLEVSFLFHWINLLRNRTLQEVTYCSNWG